MEALQSFAPAGSVVTAAALNPVLLIERMEHTQCGRRFVDASLDVPFSFFHVHSLVPLPGGEPSVVYYETIKRELNKRLIYECRCDERLKADLG